MVVEFATKKPVKFGDVKKGETFVYKSPENGVFIKIDPLTVDNYNAIRLTGEKGNGNHVAFEDFALVFPADVKMIVSY